MGFLGDLIGGIEGVGGPSTQEKTVQQDELTMMNNLTSQFGYLFDSATNAFDTVGGAFKSMVGLGLDQHGFSGPMLAALNTQAINANAAGYQKAAEALRTSEAGQGGGGEGLTSGVNAELQGALASAFAGNLANQQLGITLQDYAVGRQNFMAGLQGEEGLGTTELGAASKFAGLAQDEQQLAFNTSETVKKQQDAVTSELISGGIGLASVAAGPLAGMASSAISAVFPNADTSFLDAFSNAASGGGNG